MEQTHLENTVAQRSTPNEEVVPVVIRNVRNVIKRTSVHQMEDGVLVKELVVVEVDGGEGLVLQSFIALGIVFVGVQILAYVWKRFSSKTFTVASHCTLLLFPLATALVSRSWVFTCAWGLVAGVHCALFWDIFLGRRPQGISTRLYAGYRKVFKASMLLSLGAYVAIAYGFFTATGGVYRRGMYLAMYTLYFTLVTRICLNFISYRASGTILPSVSAKAQGSVCKMCSQDSEGLEKGGHGGHGGKRVQLKCGESFHEECLQNWKILGKKDVCPSCREKADLSVVPMSSWQRNEYVFTQILNFAENMILAYAVTQGIVFFFRL
ncbi:RING finger protein 121/175 [Nematocida sp. AWRm77]|nr:RING finger protein 121/175 [Nematocida sp. AWRm77]